MLKGNTLYSAERNKEMLGKNPESIRVFALRNEVGEPINRSKVCMAAGRTLYSFIIEEGRNERVDECVVEAPVFDKYQKTDHISPTTQGLG